MYILNFTGGTETKKAFQNVSRESNTQQRERSLDKTREVVGNDKRHESLENRLQLSGSRGTRARKASPHQYEHHCGRRMKLQTDSRLERSPLDLSSVEEFPPMSSAATGSGGGRLAKRNHITMCKSNLFFNVEHH